MNKKLTASLVLLSLLFGQTSFAKDIPTSESEEGMTEQTAMPLQEIGLQEAPALKPKDDYNLKNWLFAAGSVISATVAIIVVSLSPGSSPNSN
jgi:hypothetical protein